MLHIVVPMAGSGTRFLQNGFSMPKPLIDVNGKAMIERTLDGLQCNNADYILVIQTSLRKSYADALNKLVDKYNVCFVEVEHCTMGACCTALAAHEIINNEDIVIFADSDNFFRQGVIPEFVEWFQDNIEADGALLTFNSDKPCYSYANVDDNGFVCFTKEKEVVGNHAIAGIYAFRHGSDFVRHAISMVIYGDLTHSEYYMSNVYNYAICAGQKIKCMDIGEKDWFCVGTPEQLNMFLHSDWAIATF